MGKGRRDSGEPQSSSCRAQVRDGPKQLPWQQWRSIWKRNILNMLKEEPTVFGDRLGGR